MFKYAHLQFQMYIFVFMKQVLYSLLFFCFLMSCTSKKETATVEKKEDTIEKYHNAKNDLIKFTVIDLLNPKYKDSIKDWKGYQNMLAKINLMSESSANDILSYAEELVKDSKLMKDSITVPILENKGIATRINFIENQAKRLKDMKNISVITIDEIKVATEELYTLFGILNLKINAVYEQEHFDDELIEEDLIFEFNDSLVNVSQKDLALPESD